MNNSGYRSHGVTDEEADKLRAMGWEWSSNLLRFVNLNRRNIYPTVSNKPGALWAWAWASGPLAWGQLYPDPVTCAVAQVIGD